MSSEHRLNGLTVSQNQTNIIILALFHNYLKDFPFDLWIHLTFFYAALFTQRGSV